MNIDHSRELLYDYARGRLSEQERCHIEEQLLNSEDLRIELEKINRYYAAIDETEPTPVPEHFLEKVHQRIDSRGKRSLLHRLLFPLHLKLPVEFAGLAATVALVIYIFIPQLEKKNYSEYEPLPVDIVQQTPSASQGEMPGKSVAATSATEETTGSGQIPTEKNEISISKDMQPVSRVEQQPKSSVPKKFKTSSVANAGIKKIDDVESVPAVERLSENVPAPVSAPAPAPAQVQQLDIENNNADMSERVSAVAPAVQKNKLQKSFNKSEEETSVPERMAASFESKRMKARSAYSEKTSAKEMISPMDLETTAVLKDIKLLLSKYGMKWTVKEFTGRRTTCSASGTSAAVTSFLSEIKELPDVTLRNVVPENYSAVNDSVVVEFSVKGKIE